MPFANRWFFVAFACVGLGACAASPKPVLSVAEYDLSCPKVEVSRIDDDHYAASGCGRGAVYVRSCDDGTGCRWARMRHGHEIDVAAAQAPLYGTPAPREVIAAPPPAAREVLPAPAPGSREVVPAPPPEATSGGEAPASGAPAPASSQTPVQEDQLSQPYQAEVPAVPPAQRVQYAPPAPIVEERPPPPQVTYVWVGGYWWWGDWGWTWVPGYWAPPRRGFVWVGGGWYWYSNWWWYYPGGWCYPGSRVVVYAPAPRPQRVVTVRTIRPHAVNRSPAVASRAPGSVSPAPRAPVVSAPAPVRSSASASSFRPRESPLMRYPAPRPNVSGRLAPRPSQAQALAPGGQPGGRGGSASLGRLVRPTETVPPRSSYGSRGSQADRFDYSRSSSPDRFDRTPSTSSRSVAPSSRAPSRVSPAKPPPSSFRVPSRGSMPSRGGGPPRTVRPR